MVHGYYTKKIKSQKPISSSPCPHCGGYNSIDIVALCRVNHAMFVPFYPSQKRVVIQCGNCNTAFKPEAFPHMKTQAEELLHTARYKWFHFIGLALLIGFLSLLGFSIWQGGRERDRQNKVALLQLKTNDIIFFKTKEKTNTSMKVAQINQDTVWVYENRMATNKSARNIDVDDNYDTTLTYFLRRELNDMLEKNTITDIDY